MIAEFLSSWSLFQQTYLAGWLIGALLGLVGVVVIARDQIFLGAAIAQASTLGVALGLVLGDELAGWGIDVFQSDAALSALAVAGALAAALVTARAGGPGRESHEALTGWVFLFAASVSVLALTKSPHGLEEIHRLVASSIIGATWADVAVFATLTVLTAAFLWVAHRRVLLYALDPEMAAAVGMPLGRWAAGSSVWLGLAVGLSLRVSGIPYTFGCLVLPALIAKNVCGAVAPMFVVAPAIAVATGVVAFVLAHHWDLPPGQMTVALLCGLLVLSRVPAARRAGEAAS